MAEAQALAPDPPPKEEESADSRHWQIAAQIIGAAAALAAWVAVVGGARWWARLHAADIPTNPALSTLPRELLIATGLQTLLLPLVLGASVALLAMLTLPPRRVKALPAPVTSLANVDPPASEVVTPGDDDPPKGEVEDSNDPNATEPPKRPPRSLHELWTLISSTAAIASITSLRRDNAPDLKLAVVVSLTALLGGLVLSIIRPDLGTLWSWLGGVSTLVGVLLLIYASPINWWRARKKGGDRKLQEWALGIALLVAVVGVPLAFVVAAEVVVEVDKLAAMVMVTFVALWLAAAATYRWPDRAVVVTFIGLALWSGTIAFLRELGLKKPQLETATVELTRGRIADHFLLTASKDSVVLATKSKPPNVVVVARKDVSRLRVGPLESVKDATGPVPPAPTPEPKAPPFELVLDGVPLRLELKTFRREGQMLHLTLRLTNTGKAGAKTFTIGDLFDDLTEGPPDELINTVDGVTVRDPSTLREYLVGRRKPGGQCECASGLERRALLPGKPADLDAYFGWPGVRPLDIKVPVFGSFSRATPDG